jgi:hypothetical protein
MLQIAHGVLTISGGAIGPGQFDEFSFSARNPEQPGALKFPAVQTYNDGRVQNWIGPEGADEPAPSVEITTTQGTAATDGPAGGSGGMPVAVLGLVTGLLGMILGGTALARTRRPTPERAPAGPETTPSSV